MHNLAKLTKHKIKIKNHTIFRINNRVYPGEKPAMPEITLEVKNYGKFKQQQ